jgi:hypothetical protein
MENIKMQLKRSSSLANGACAGILGLAVATALLAQDGQRGFNQIYNFGAQVEPTALTGTGNALYGATQVGGSQGVGSVYALTQPATPGGPWTYTTLYSFGSSPTDGSTPFGVAIGGFSGSLPVLYGTTYGGGDFGRGTVFCLLPPQTPGGAWTEQILHSFGGADGSGPEAPVVVAMKTGGLPVLYGTTLEGGASGDGAIFSLIPPTTQGGAWTEHVLYSFGSDPTGVSFPKKLVLGKGASGPVLYGFTAVGGTNENGAVFSLADVGNTLMFDVIYSLPPTSVTSGPSSLAIGNNGVLYGALAPAYDVADSDGEVYSLTPPASEGGSWTESTVYSFGGVLNDGSNPGSLLAGSNGDLYGVTAGGGFGDGTVFALTPSASPGGTWTETILYRFPFNGDTSSPSSLGIGPEGALYGTTYYGVSTVFQLQP